MTRREMLALAPLAAGFASSGAASRVHLASYLLESRAQLDEVGAALRRASGAALLLEAVAAAHMPRLLVLDASQHQWLAPRPTSTSVFGSVTRCVAGAGAPARSWSSAPPVFELRVYDDARGLDVERLRATGIEPLLHGATDEGWTLLSRFDSAERRNDAWTNFACEDPRPRLREVALFREWRG